MKIAVLFPGQGSQYLGMGQEFVTSSASCAALLGMAEACCELPLGELCRSGPMEELTKAGHLQPALTAVNLICWQAFAEALPQGIEISCFAGHSLGEYSALHAAGVLGLEETMRLVARRGALMEREGKTHPGAMRAVLGLTIAQIEEYIADYQGEGTVTVANHNTPEQIVLAGSPVALDVVCGLLEGLGARIVPLNVSIANHSPLMAGAVADYAEFVADIQFFQPKTPVYFNITGGLETSRSSIKELMIRQIVSRVQWSSIIEAMLADGVDTFVEIGPKAVLKGMIRKIVPKGTAVTALQFDNPQGLEQVLGVLQTGAMDCVLGTRNEKLKA
jgi:[acyl-carrier-protein] S-malonyltransferase